MTDVGMTLLQVGSHLPSSLRRRDCSAQIFRHHASQLLSKWREKAPDDPRGWFQWYDVTTSAAASGRTFGTIIVLLLAARQIKTGQFLLQSGLSRPEVREQPAGHPEGRRLRVWVGLREFIVRFC